MFNARCRRLQVLRRHQLAGRGGHARRPGLRAQHPGRRVERRHAGRATPTRAATSSSARRRARRGQVLDTPIGDDPGLQQRARGHGGGPPLQLRRRLPAAVGRARRRGRAGAGQPANCSKIFILTEKMSVHDAREIRAHGPAATASTSSAATAWAWPTPGTRCGSAARSAATIPADTLRKGSIAILSNSGGFTTTIAQYLRMAGWGTTTLDLERQGRLHPLRGAGVRLRPRQRRRAARRRCCTASRAATTSATPTSTSRWSPASSDAGRAS